MIKTQIIQTAQFQVKGASGKTYTIIEQTTQIDGTTIADTQTRWLNDEVRYIVLGGGAVDKTAGDEFLIVDSGESATRI